MRSDRCRGCKAEFDPTKPFCSNCGYQLQGRVEHMTRRAVLTVLFVFSSVFVVLFLQGWWSPLEYESGAVFVRDQFLTTLGVLACGVSALGILGGWFPEREPGWSRLIQRSRLGGPGRTGLLHRELRLCRDLALPRR